MHTRYRIYSLSARAVLSYAQAEDDRYIFRLSRKATEKCKVYGAAHEQDDNALFYQIMCVLRGDGFVIPRNERFQMGAFLKQNEDIWIRSSVCI